MAILPAEIPTGIVTGQFYFVSEDNVDADTDPELTVVAGDVIFTCTATSPLRMPTKLATVIPLEFKAKFNAQGELVSESDATLGIQLPATDSPLFNPTDFTWKVIFDLVQVENRHTVKIDPFEFQVPEGEIVDLTLVMPVDASPGVLTVQGPQGIQGLTGEQGPPVSLTVGEVMTGPSTPGTQGPIGLTGAKGDPGGFSAATDLGVTDLNGILTAGLYRQALATNATPERNYPALSSGSLEVLQGASATEMIQRFTPFSGVAAIGRVIYVRRYTAAAWSAWTVYMSARMDNSSGGRAMYIWDHLGNRDQLVYGDTGERDITALINGTAAAFKIRRYGATVEIVCVNWQPSVNGQGVFLNSLPIGWRNTNTHAFWSVNNTTGAAVNTNIGASGSNIVLGGNVTTSTYSFFITYLTVDPWPTAMIGTLVGSIPTT